MNVARQKDILHIAKHLFSYERLKTTLLIQEAFIAGIYLRPSKKHLLLCICEEAWVKNTNSKEKNFLFPKSTE